MVGAGVARKVDFGEGRSRFEPTYRHPRHFHLICNTCHRSSGVPELRRRVADGGDRGGAQLRADAARSSRSTAPARSAGPAHEHADDRRRDDRAGVCARRAAGSRSPPSAAASSSTPRAAGMTKDARGARRVPASSPKRRRNTSARCEKRYRELVGAGSAARVAADVPLLQGRGQRICSPRAPSSCARAASTIVQALLIGIRCERGSHKFFKRYGERFEDSEGKADLPRVCRRRARASRSADPRVSIALERQGRRPRAARATLPPAPGRAR